MWVYGAPYVNFTAKILVCRQALAHEVACYLGLDLGGIKIKRFADGEIYVQVQARALIIHCTFHLVSLATYCGSSSICDPLVSALAHCLAS